MSNERLFRDDAFISMNNKESSEDIDSTELTRVVWRKKWLVLAITLALTAAAGAFIYALPSHYVAEALLVIGNREDVRVSSNGTTMPIAKSDPETIQTEIEMLQSPALAAQVVEALHLQERPEFNPYLAATANGKDAKAGLSGILGALRGVVGSIVPSLSESDKRAQDVTPAMQLTATIDNFVGRLQVATKGASRVVSVYFGASDPVLAARAVNALIDHYIGDQIAGQSKSATETEHWVDQRTADLRAKAEAAERAVEDYRASHQLFSGPGGTSLANSELIDVTNQLTRAQAAANSLATRGRSGGNSRGGGEGGSSSLLTTLQTQEAETERQLAASSADLGARNPTILGLQASLRETRGKIATERSKLSGSAAGSAESRLRAARATEETLRDRLATIKQDIGRSGVAGVTLHMLEREAAANRIVFENFLARSVELAHAGDRAAGHVDAQIVSRANVPTSPDKPKRSMLLLIAMACALIFGIAVAIFLEKLKRGYRSIDQVEAFAGTHGLGLVPLVGAAHMSPLAVSRNAGSSYYASIRSIWTTLSLILEKKPKIILVTSALPQEGKTTLALSLAAIAGHGGHRTLLVDADFWRGCASAALGLGRSSGLAELLDAKVSFDDVIVSDIGAGIDIIRPGTLPRGYDLTIKDKLVRLLAQFSQRYEYIIIDAPPVLAISEMLSVAANVTTTILAVRWDSTPRNVVNLALRRLREARAPVQGIVLTMVDERKHAQSGHADSAYFSKDIMNYYSQSLTPPYAPLALQGPDQVKVHWRRGGELALAVLRRLGHARLPQTRIARYDRPRWAVLVVDVQEDFLKRSGWAGIGEAALPAFLDGINRVSEAAADHGALIVYTRQEFGTLRGDLISRTFFHGAGAKNAPDNRIHPDLRLMSGHQFHKSKWNAFSNLDLDRFLKTNRIDHLCLLGIDGAGSIDDTAKSAIERGYRVTFISDCIATPFEHDWAERLTGFEDDRAFAVSSRLFIERLDARNSPKKVSADRITEARVVGGARLNPRDKPQRLIDSHI